MGYDIPLLPTKKRKKKIENIFWPTEKMKNNIGQILPTKKKKKKKKRKEKEKLLKKTYY